jgi:hypothetical protein
MELSGSHGREQLIVVGFGATDVDNDRSMQRHLGKLADYVSHYRAAARSSSPTVSMEQTCIGPCSRACSIPWTTKGWRIRC